VPQAGRGITELEARHDRFLSTAGAEGEAVAEIRTSDRATTTPIRGSCNSQDACALCFAKPGARPQGCSCAALGKRVNMNQALQLNRCNVPESPCHWRSFGSDQRLPLLLAKSMLGN
jgi:hypothetical protein